MISSVSGSCEALSSPTRAMCSAICVPCVTTSSRRSVHAWAIPVSTCRNDGSPCCGTGGKYVPAKNGLPSGVRNAVNGQPPLPVIACAASM